jgi:hypothetical protein
MTKPRRKERGETGTFNGQIVVHNLESMGKLANLILAKKDHRGVSFFLQALDGREAKNHIPQCTLVYDQCFLPQGSVSSPPKTLQDRCDPLFQNP